jgi:serine/threonine-protein kinase
MPLAAGARLGPFQIAEPLGAGGMGEVYRARDTRLNRDVAIKILPETFALDADRLARFKREAQVLAALNHPNIAAIYGLEETDGIQALVLELVEGPTLADRIADGPIAVEEALPIARQIAEALEAAHEQGIIHRDLKPANIKVREDRSVKVLDFGLAKLAASDNSSSGMAGLSMSPTITTPAATGIGMILGTAAYMSPEQARGKVVDRRADVWAFGCVLYEMLTGLRAFPGEDVTETIASVVKSEPDWDLLPVDLSPTPRVYLRRCLQKNPRDRVHDIGDVRLAIDGAFDVAVPPPQPPAEAVGTTPWRSPTAAAAALALILVTAVATWVVMAPAAERPAPLRRFAISTGQVPLVIANRNRDVAITPDGSRLVYFAGLGANRQLYVRALDALEGTPIRQADRFFEPFVSPDSRWVGFNDEADFTLRKVPIAGGPPVTITAVGREILGATWGPDDTIVFATTDPGTGLRRVSAGGGAPTALTTPDKARGEIQHSWPEFLPGGRAVLYTIQSGERGEEFQIAVLDIESGESRTLVPGGSSPRFSPSGHLVYGAENTIRAVPFDLARLEVLGDPIPLIEGVIMKGGGGGADFSVSADGTLVYIAGGAGAALRRLVWAERDGARRPINAPPHGYTSARISPDGTRVALDARDQQSDIWIWDFARETLRRLTTDPNVDFAPIWTRDGRRIVFSSSRVSPNTLFVQAADGTGGTERLTEGTETHVPNAFSPDGRRLIFRADSGTATGQDLRMLVLDGEPRIMPLIQSPFNERNAEISPDGKWIAFQSNESGADEVYVRPFPDVESGRWQVSTAGGAQPAWAPNGRELFYVAADGRLMAVDVRSQAGFAAGVPRMLVDGGFLFNLATSQNRSYDVSPDGTRFLLIEAPNTGTQADTAGLTVVLNWADELKRLVPVNGP